jgi:hypothetical protein
VEFERLCSDILSRLGFRGLDPQGIGKKDGGKDALLLINYNKKIVFHFSLRKDWKKKLKEDLETVKKSGKKYTDFVFVSSQTIAPGERDKLRDSIQKEYGWKSEIFDAERMRVELDTHSKDLRLHYLHIANDYDSYIEKIADEFIEKWGGDKISYMPPQNYSRLLLLAIPNKEKSNRMNLFDSSSKFIGDQSKLNHILGQNLIEQSTFKAKICSNYYSTYVREKDKRSMPLYSHTNPYIYESNIYNSGVCEVLIDLTDKIVKPHLFNIILDNFSKTINELYNGVIGNKEYIHIYFILINCDSLPLEKNDGNYYFGESEFFIESKEDQFDKIVEKPFFVDFSKVVINKIDNFFNEIEEH